MISYQFQPVDQSYQHGQAASVTLRWTPEGKVLVLLKDITGKIKQELIFGNATGTINWFGCLAFQLHQSSLQKGTTQ